MSAESRQHLTELAARCGLRAVRFTGVAPLVEMDAFESWLDADLHGGLDWLLREREVRRDPALRLPGARTAIVFAIEHAHRRPPDPGGATGMVARYAWGRDYHNLVGKRLKKLRKALRDEGVRSWGGVDTAPILERAWARAAGVGFTGKNCVLIAPGRTSWMFLAVLFVDVDAVADAPLARDHCGRCTRCLSACPTEAFLGPRRLDAGRCLSTWTIEAAGLAPRALRPAFGRWVFGCDVCQEVCPHNAAPPDPEEADLLPRHAWIDLPELLATPDAAVDDRYRGTPLLRAGAIGLKRNALVALGNLADPARAPVALAALAHPSPVVRGAAVWCLDQLGHPAARTHRDEDPLVRDEIAAAWGDAPPGP